VGKVLLAFAPEETVESIIHLQRLQRFTHNTITTPSALRAELQRVRQQSFAVDMEEFEPDVCCVAMPVRDYTGRVVAAVGITGLVRRLNPCDENTLSLLRQAAEGISLQLGWRAPDK
jgi:DNA-binding IclR family transcriptional regulator